MGKKGRRQEDPGAEKGEGSDSSEDNKACPHVKKFKHKSQKANRIPIVAACKLCNDSKSKAQVEEKSPVASNQQDNAGETDLLMCLFCGSVGCGENGQGHALTHQRAPRSDCHDFAFDLKKGTIWCFLCQKEVRSTSLENTMKAWQKKIEVPSSKTSASETEVKNPNQPTPFLNKEKCIANKKPLLVKGLMNLGNTCFFNSVLQCLAQTPYLIPVLERLIIDGETCRIPGNDKLTPLDCILSNISSIKDNIALPLIDLLKCMRSRESNTVVRPEDLLRRLQSRYVQFKGHEQHDAHELLRHLLEGVRKDDLKRFQAEILKRFDCYGGPQKRSGLSEETKKVLISYNFQANDLLLGPDVLFRGELISTLECRECLNTSVRTEHFLDLSLPVTEEKPLPPTRKKDMDHTTGPSKHHSKKEMREKKKALALAARQATRNENATSSQTKDPTASNESDNSDADVEDNAEPDTSLAENRNDVIESGYSSEKAQNGDSAHSVSPAESGCAEGELSLSMEAEAGDSLPPETKAVTESASSVDAPGCDEAKPPLPFSVDDVESEIGSLPTVRWLPMDLEINASSSLPLINEIPASPMPSPSPKSASKGSDDDVFDFQLPSNSSSHDFQLPCGSASRECEPNDGTVNDCAEGDMLKCSPTEGGDGDGGQCPLDISDLRKRLSSLMCGENGALEGSACSDKGGSSNSVAKESISSSSSWTRTLAPITTINEGDCSILSCLKQFTAVELMHSSNKVGCENCTKIKGKNGATVLTNSAKQLLISAPPAVLIIHLKRFIADICRLKKMNRHVTFPMSLDLAPFCSIKCRELPSVKPDQTEIIYSLYGVVEHSGQMGGGHYVAYVKVRPSLGDQDPRWNFLAPGRSFLQTRPDQEESSQPSAPNSPEEQWYYVSDSHVSAVDEEKVKRVQAYVLFYERVV